MLGAPVPVEAEGIQLSGDITVPEAAQGIVLFAHGSGSSRLSPRNRTVANELVTHRIGTLLFDLLTAEEGSVDLITRELRFDVSLLTRRLVGAIDWLDRQPGLADLPLGLFGASTGAAAALAAAACLPGRVTAIVSRGGRPDLAGAFLEQVSAPTLLLVGAADEEVLALNREAAARLPRARLEIVSEASHLFSEPGALEQVASLSRDFFLEHLPAQSSSRPAPSRARASDRRSPTR